MITLTEKAATKVQTLQEQEGKPGYLLRLKVVGGGCSGYSYSLDFVKEAAPNDTVYEDHGVKMAVDPKSLSMIDNSQVEWVDGMTGAGFTLQNPNAKASCGCGHSFSV
jgi:iron-sulfur cluster assembly accessory protein